MIFKKAIILAGGEGRRLKPYTLTIPKPLMPVGSYPIIDLVIKYLLKYNFKNITIALNYKGDLIKSFLKNIKNKSIKIEYSFEKKTLGTIGPLKLIKKLPENFLVINGDVLTDLNLQEFYKSHIKSKSFWNQFKVY
jgi:NDP-sugar pyrophosphorylase family protein